MAKMAQHGDFGEKIGGARKDLWQKRGLYSDDLVAMNEREAEKYVRKDYVWKKPDYQALIEGGLPVDAAYFIKTIRDSIPTAPLYRYTDDTPGKRLDRQKQYVDTVREIQAVIEGVKTKEDALAAFDRCLIEPGYCEKVQPGRSYYASPTEKARGNPAITDDLAKAMFFKSDFTYDTRIVQKAASLQFGVPKEDKTPRGYAIRFNDGKNTWSKDNEWKPDTWYVVKDRHVLKTNFESREAALKWVQEFAKQRGAGGKTKFVPPQLEHVRREGPDYRRDRNMDGQDYLDTFGFKGGEFGNWMSQLDRQGSLNMGFDALKDLAAALKISDRDISYQGALSIAFGARGSGGAVAHYEPMRQVINLTKMRGAGSLAHEWWHGLDDFLGKKLGVKGMLSESPHKHPLFAKLMDAIKYKPETPEQAAARTESADSRVKTNADNWLRSVMLSSVNRSEKEANHVEFETLRADYLRGVPGSVDRLSDLKKRLTGRVIPKQERDTLHTFERVLGQMGERSGAEPTIGKTKTDYYLASIEMGKISEKDGGYWESNTEMTARAFAIYVMDRLPGRSDYLAGHAECAVGLKPDKDGGFDVVKAFPLGAEREAINAVFDEIVAELKRERHLAHDEHARPVPASARQAPARSITLDTPIIAAEQLTFASFGGEERPSALGRLAAAKELAAKNGAEKPAPGKTKEKAHDTAL